MLIYNFYSCAAQGVFNVSNYLTRNRRHWLFCLFYFLSFNKDIKAFISVQVMHRRVPLVTLKIIFSPIFLTYMTLSYKLYCPLVRNRCFRKLFHNIHTSKSPPERQADFFIAVAKEWNHKTNFFQLVNTHWKRQ